MDELEKTIKWLENSRGGNKTIRAAIAEIRRLQAIKAAAREYLEVVDNSAYSSLDIPYSVRLQKYEALKSALDATP